MTTALARNPELQVIARDSTYAVRGQETDVRKLGAKLGVDYVVEGSARREGDQLRVSAQLIDVETGAHLWSRSFDRKVADVFTVQSELTTEIVAQLAPYIGRSEAAAAAQRPTDNLQAYDLVLQARDRYRHGATDQKRHSRSPRPLPARPGNGPGLCRRPRGSRADLYRRCGTKARTARPPLLNWTSASAKRGRPCASILISALAIR